MSVPATTSETNWATASTPDNVHALLALQQQEGFWFGDNAEVGKIIGLDAALAKDPSTGEERDILVTFIVIKFLKTKCADEEATWRLAIRKSNAWIIGKKEDFDYHWMKALDKRADMLEGVVERTEM